MSHESNPPEAIPFPDELSYVRQRFDAFHSEVLNDYGLNCGDVAKQFIFYDKHAQGMISIRTKNGDDLSPLPYDGRVTFRRHLVAHIRPGDPIDYRPIYILDPILEAPVLEEDYPRLAFGLTWDDIVIDREEAEFYEELWNM